MRLLKTNPSQSNTLEFHTIQNPHEVPYSILSHTWSPNPDDEVLYPDVLSGTSHTKAAIRKIQSAMRQSRHDGYDYCWVDTCCIDKSSSAELSEAINSMWRWYSLAERCYAYLADVPVGLHEEALGMALKDSKWVTRGWTLQELLAPREVVFYGHEWLDESESGKAEGKKSQSGSSTCLGTKANLTNILSQITGIDPAILNGEREIRSASIAQRMSWAAKRVTTRAEDAAYSLMGIFDVNMPMLYGEGGKAFLRLQEEIVKNSDDQSIFAWSVPRDGPAKDQNDEELSGLLAPNVQAFNGCEFIFPYSTDPGDERPPWWITNKGLSITLPLRIWQGDGIYLATLDCYHGYFQGSPGIFLKRLKARSRQFARVRDWEVVAVTGRSTTESIFVRQTPVVAQTFKRPASHVLQLSMMRKFVKKRFMGWEENNFGNDYKLKQAESQGNALESGPERGPRWIESPKPFLFNMSPAHLAAALLVQSPSDRIQFILLVGASSKLDVEVASLISDFGSTLDNFESYQAFFEDHSEPATCSFTLDRIRVTCRAETRNDAGAVRHVVTIDLYVSDHGKPGPVRQLKGEYGRADRHCRSTVGG